MSDLMHILSFSAVFSDSHNLDFVVNESKKSELKFVKISLNLVNSSQFCDLNQDLVGDFQGIFNYQPSISASKLIVYSTIYLWFQSITMYIANKCK